MELLRTVHTRPWGKTQIRILVQSADIRSAVSVSADTTSSLEQVPHQQMPVTRYRCYAENVSKGSLPMHFHMHFPWVKIIIEARHESLQLFCGTICYMCSGDPSLLSCLRATATSHILSTEHTLVWWQNLCLKS